MNKQWWWLVVLLLAVACKSTKETTGEVERMRPRALLKEVRAQAITYQSLQAKAKIEYATPNDKSSFKGDVRMLKDSIIWLSIKPALGLEVARIVITPDSIKVLDRINKQYLIQPYSYITQLYEAPIDFALLQSLIAGGLLDDNPRGLTVDIVDNHYLLVYESDAYRNSMHINPFNFTINQLLIEDPAYNREVRIDYDDYTAVDDQLFSHRRQVVAEANAQYRLALDFSRVSFNRDLNVTFVVNDNYERIE